MGNLFGDTIHHLSPQKRMEYLITGYFRESFQNDQDFFIQFFSSNKQKSNLKNMGYDIETLVGKYIGEKIASPTEIEEYIDQQNNILKQTKEQKAANIFDVKCRMIMLGIEGCGIKQLLNILRKYTDKPNQANQAILGINFETIYLTQYNYQQYKPVIHACYIGNGLINKYIKYLKDTFAIIWVINSNDSNNFNRSKNELHCFLNKYFIKTKNNSTPMRLLVVITNQDISNNTLTIDEIENKLDLTKYGIRWYKICGDSKTFQNSTKINISQNQIGMQIPWVGPGPPRMNMNNMNKKSFLSGMHWLYQSYADSETQCLTM